ncbi:LacI family DNA-binding transcriptional regulator [Streptomyces sp. NPDC059255]|uniref:LacI family DNA-binding transcriptional regulator n=1 Tax=Streptomyces sp. NPDC059255 TaxID=3346793 RepID=UPI0036A156E2
MAGRQAVTTRDIADQLGISISTVGRALSDDPRISRETRFRVKEKAAELGYVGNLAARLIRGAPSTVVGLIVPDVRNSFYSTAAHALAQTMAQHGYQVMLSETDDHEDNELAQVKGLAAAQVAGVIIVPTPNPRAGTVRLLRTMPHVQFLRQQDKLGDHWFGVDDRQVLRQATEHLVSLGHRRIAYLGGPPGRSTSTRRLEGFTGVLGADADPELIIHTPPSSIEDARRAVGTVLSSPRRPTAIVTASVRITEGLLQELTARGMDVPREMSVVGFGDEPGFSWWGGGLTTMALPVHEVATSCAMWLLQRLRDTGNDAPYNSRAAGYLVTRGSTDVPRSGA